MEAGVRTIREYLATLPGVFPIEEMLPENIRIVLGSMSYLQLVSLKATSHKWRTEVSDDIFRLLALLHFTHPSSVAPTSDAFDARIDGNVVLNAAVTSPTYALPSASRSLQVVRRFEAVYQIMLATLRARATERRATAGDQGLSAIPTATLHAIVHGEGNGAAGYWQKAYRMCAMACRVALSFLLPDEDSLNRVSLMEATLRGLLADPLASGVLDTAQQSPAWRARAMWSDADGRPRGGTEQDHPVTRGGSIIAPGLFVYVRRAEDTELLHPIYAAREVDALPADAVCYLVPSTRFSRSSLVPVAAATALHTPFRPRQFSKGFAFYVARPNIVIMGPTHAYLKGLSLQIEFADHERNTGVLETVDIVAPPGTAGDGEPTLHERVSRELYAVAQRVRSYTLQRARLYGGENPAVLPDLVMDVALVPRTGGRLSGMLLERRAQLRIRFAYDPSEDLIGALCTVGYSTEALDIDRLMYRKFVRNCNAVPDPDNGTATSLVEVADFYGSHAPRCYAILTELFINGGTAAGLATVSSHTYAPGDVRASLMGAAPPPGDLEDYLQGQRLMFEGARLSAVLHKCQTATPTYTHPVHHLAVTLALLAEFAWGQHLFDGIDLCDPDLAHTEAPAHRPNVDPVAPSLAWLTRRNAPHPRSFRQPTRGVYALIDLFILPDASPATTFRHIPSFSTHLDTSMPCTHCEGQRAVGIAMASMEPLCSRCAQGPPFNVKM